MGPTRLELTKPVIAAAESYAVAGGLELALWAGLRVVSEGAVFGAICPRFGVSLVDLGTVRLLTLHGGDIPTSG
ncbi:MAG: enoyl-CoA hydratase-related protein [Caulobacteraceae bacterium]